MTTIADRLRVVEQRIAAAARAAGRDPAAVSLLAVSKTWGPDAVREAAAAGQHAFGENYVQEGVAKVLATAGLGLEWHFIGPIPSNKTRLIAATARWVHSVDSVKVAKRLSEPQPTDAPALNVCLQVNTRGEASQSGAQAGELPELATNTAANTGAANNSVTSARQPARHVIGGQSLILPLSATGAAVPATFRTAALNSNGQRINGDFISEAGGVPYRMTATMELLLAGTAVLDAFQLPTLTATSCPVGYKAIDFQVTGNGARFVVDGESGLPTATQGIPLPAGLVEGSQLPEPIFTPATKEESGHDMNISFETMVEMVGRETSEELRRRSLAVYERGAEYARSRGILIADTKFEWGTTDEGIILIDEVMTPDSSRFWPLDAFQPGGAQPSFDKQFVRDWLETTGWAKNSPPPELPTDVVAKTRAKYVEAYERLTGSEFGWK